MLTSEIAQMLGFIRLAFVASVNPDGTPNVSPKGTLRVLNEEHLFFANIASHNTARNIENNPHVEVNVIDFYGTHYCSQNQ